MSVAEEKPAVDAILLKVLEAVPFQLTTDGGVEASRQRFRDLPRRPVHPDVRTEDRTIDGPAGPIPIRVYRPPTDSEATLPVVVFLHGGGWSVGDLDTYDGEPAITRSGRARWWCRWITGWRPNTPTPPRSKMPGPQRNGWRHTPASWAPTRTGSPSQETRRAGTWRRWWRSWRATPADRRSGSSCCGIRRRRGTRRCRRSQRTPNAPLLGDSAVKGFSRWYVGDLDLSDMPATLAPARAKDLAGLPRRISPSRATTPCATTAPATPNCLPRRVCQCELHNAETLIHGYLGYAGVVPAATDAAERGLSALREALHAT